ncbi:uncharacterized protein LOC115622348 [Scaptodrosophila lebanonensis]|uniref:Uncharacterized protein LOC115622348 n=1 Tax=Drosophila lebanonensis TaxID=7225 RepID=A0A6J2T5B8_DROLE|nr:uncharacterized protein LOC115622348 [Scaptodrosophila lebanonensis]XP_030372122.1 uncharacterized protein LOC115622348 [Scaptodrosophila lebanonensis]
MASSSSIDTSQRKPRRTRGTPSFHYRNRFAAAFIVVGSALFGLWNLTPIQRICNEKLIKALETSETEIDRHALFDFPAPRPGKFIRETIEEAEKLRVER